MEINEMINDEKIIDGAEWKELEVGDDAVQSLYSNISSFIKKEGMANPEKEAKNIMDQATPQFAEKTVTADYFKNSVEELIKKYGLNEKSAQKIRRATLSDLDEKNRKMIKNQLRSAKETVKQLEKDIRNEVAHAKLNGWNQKSAESYMQKSEALVDWTNREIALRAKMEERGLHFTDIIKDLGQGAKDCMRNIADACNAKINSGIKTLTGIRDDIHNANVKFRTARETVYMNLDEMSNARLRNHMAVMYNADKVKLENYKKLDRMLERHCTRKAEIRGAFSNVWKAIRGKQQETEFTVEYTPLQQKFHDFLKSQEKSVEIEMDEVLSQYNESKSVTYENIKSQQKARQDAALDFSKSLNERFKDAQNKCIMQKESVIVRSTPQKVNSGMERAL